MWTKHGTAVWCTKPAWDHADPDINQEELVCAHRHQPQLIKTSKQMPWVCGDKVQAAAPLTAMDGVLHSPRRGAAIVTEEQDGSQLGAGGLKACNADTGALPRTSQATMLNR
jgi:hypothetical protein